MRSSLSFIQFLQFSEILQVYYNLKLSREYTTLKSLSCGGRGEIRDESPKKMCWKSARESAALQRYISSGDLASKRGEKAKLMRCLIYATEIRIIASTRCRVSPRSSLKPIKSSFCILSAITRPIVPFLFFPPALLRLPIARLLNAQMPTASIFARAVKSTIERRLIGIFQTRKRGGENVRGVAGRGYSFVRKRN